jgi:hypothetical protein
MNRCPAHRLDAIPIELSRWDTLDTTYVKIQQLKMNIRSHNVTTKLTAGEFLEKALMCFIMMWKVFSLLKLKYYTCTRSYMCTSTSVSAFNRFKVKFKRTRCLEKEKGKTRLSFWEQRAEIYTEIGYHLMETSSMSDKAFTCLAWSSVTVGLFLKWQSLEIQLEPVTDFQCLRLSRNIQESKFQVQNVTLATKLFFYR